MLPNSRRQVPRKDFLFHRLRKYGSLLVLGLFLLGWDMAQHWINLNNCMLVVSMIVNLIVFGLALRVIILSRHQESHDSTLHE